MTADQIVEFVSQYFFTIAVSLFVLVVLAEMLVPMARQECPLAFRWFTNLGLAAIDLAIFRVAGPLLALFSALAAEHMELGLLNRGDFGLPLLLIAGLMILDLKQYVFHRLMHYFDLLWSVHRVHHSDIDIDVTTSFRFHPIEAILTSLFTILVIMVFGIPVEVLALEMILVHFANFFSHGNLKLPPRLDRSLKWVLVTPSMHHLHHAMDKRAANSNFGTLFSFWDRMFGTYLGKHPAADDAPDRPNPLYGLREFREPGRLGFFPLMVMPFKPVAADSGEVLLDRK